MPVSPPAYDQGQARRTVILIGATCFMFFAAWAWVFFDQKPRVADGEIQSISAVPLHTEFRQGGTKADGGFGGGIQKSDEMYVWVAITMKNLTADVPLYETRQKATLTLPDGEQQFAYAASPSEVAKVRSLPKLQQPEGALLPRELTLKPGQGAQGLALFAFPITPDTWKTHRDFSIEISFQWQRDLALREPKPKL